MHKSLIVLICCFIFFGCQPSSEEKLGSENNPIKIYFTPSVDSETITTNSNEFLMFLEKETGLYFKSGVPASYVAVVEAFGSERADIAVMNSFGYLMANEKYGAQAKMMVMRYGKKYYRGQIITRIDSGINSVEDLQNKSFAFTDSSSTSGHLFPLKILKEKNIKLKNTTFGIKHDVVATMVYQKQVDAGATFYSAPGPDGEIRDARARIKTQFPDVAEKVKIIALTEKIMNDPFVFRKNMPSKIVKKIIAAIFKFIGTDKGKEIFKNIYSVDGLVPATDKDYDGLRKMISINKIDPVKLLQ